MLTFDLIHVGNETNQNHTCIRHRDLWALVQEAEQDVQGSHTCLSFAWPSNAPMYRYLHTVSILVCLDVREVILGVSWVRSHLLKSPSAKNSWGLGI